MHVKKIMYGAIVLLIILLIMFLDIGYDIIPDKTFSFISAVMYTKVMIAIVGLLGAGLLIESGKYKEFGYLYISMIVIYLLSYLIMCIYLSTAKTSSLDSLANYSKALETFTSIMEYCDYALAALLVFSIVVELDIKTPISFGFYISTLLYVFYDKLFGEPTIMDKNKTAGKLLVLFAAFAFGIITLFVNKIEHINDEVVEDINEETTDTEENNINNNSNQSNLLQNNQTTLNQSSLNQPPISQSVNNMGNTNQNSLNPTNTNSSEMPVNKNFTVINSPVDNGPVNKNFIVKNDLQGTNSLNSQPPMSSLNSAPPMSVANNQPLGVAYNQNNLGNNQ